MTYSSRSALVGDYRGRQFFITGERVYRWWTFLVLNGQIFQVQLNVDVFLLFGAGKWDMVGRELTFELILSENRRIFEEFRHA